eukprot:TRINITY_DN633_c0_g1_i10.p1 TRINITY_DN633_c0_g1~~TRINITY_DN633_c0_g1_i10.p1  ORF type:complete len:223 (-),score=36.87 TRINITY_DN633_c0_g1_i10:1050-1718(-)
MNRLVSSCKQLKLSHFARFLTNNHTGCFAKCWACDKEMPGCDFFCAGCNKIQPPSNDETDLDFFDLLEMPHSFKVNKKELDKSYRRLQKKLHPDLFSQTSSTEQDYSQMQSARINNAYHILRDPHKRAQYMLEIKGRDAFSSEDVRPDPGLLIEIFGYREILDGCETDSQREMFEVENNKRIEELEHRIDDAFSVGDLDLVEKLVIRMQYLRRIKDEMNDLG